MKKEMVLVFVIGSMSIMHAMDLDLADQKKGKTFPGKQARLCCPVTSSVPQCFECHQQRIADRSPLEQKPSESSKSSSSLPTIRFCP